MLIDYKILHFLQLENGQQIRTVSLSSDDDMIDITTTGTVTERSIHGEEQGSHCEYLLNFTICCLSYMWSSTYSLVTWAKVSDMKV